MAVCLNAGSHPVEDLHPLSSGGAEGFNGLQLVGPVHDDPAHAPVHGQLQLAGELVVAVELDTLGREAGCQGGVELAAGDHVHAHPGPLHQPAHAGGTEGLGRIGDPASRPAVQKVPAQLIEAALYGGLGIDVQRGSIFLGQLRDVTAIEEEPAVFGFHHMIGPPFWYRL